MWQQHLVLCARYARGSPQQAKAGKHIAGGYKACLFALTGDLDYFCSILGMPRYDLRSGPCAWCQCQSTGPNTWTDFRETAPWRATRWSHGGWHAWGEKSRCTLLQLPGASCWTIAYDYMHVKHLGTDMYQFGSCLALLVRYVLPDTPEQNLQVCWSFLKSYFRQHKTPNPYRYLNRLSMFIRNKGKYPKLRGKAAEVKSLGPGLLALWEDKMNPNLAIHRQVRLMLRANCRMEEILSENKDEWVLPASAAVEFEETCRTMLLLQTQLAEHFLQESEALFDITSKTHMLQEISLMGRCINPRLVWAYAGEDMMQRMQQIAMQCTQGNSQGQTTIKMARHYRLGLHYLFKRLHGIWDWEVQFVRFTIYRVVAKVFSFTMHVRKKCTYNTRCISTTASECDCLRLVTLSDFDKNNEWLFEKLFEWLVE